MKKTLLISMAGAILFANANTNNINETKSKQSTKKEHNILIKNDTNNFVRNNIKTAINNQEKKIKEENKAINANPNKKTILLAIRNMGEALLDLKANKKVEAEDKINYTINLLKKIKKDEILVEKEIAILEFIGTIEDAKKLIKATEKAMKQKAYQAASAYLNLLKDEMDILSIYINKNYVLNKLEKIKKKIESNDIKKAFIELATLFRNKKTVNKYFTIYPLGIVKADYLIRQADVLNSLKNKKKTDYQHIVNLIEEAKKELLLDNKMGYFVNTKAKILYIELINILNSLEEKAKSQQESMHKQYQKAEKMIQKITKQTIIEKENPKYQIIKR